MYLTTCVFFHKICSIYGDFAGKKIFCKGIYNAVLVNHMRLTYGDFEKVSKKHENAMKNGKFIIFFEKNGKNVFYYGE